MITLGTPTAKRSEIQMSVLMRDFMRPSAGSASNVHRDLWISMRTASLVIGTTSDSTD